jgi:transposase
LAWWCRSRTLAALTGHHIILEDFIAAVEAATVRRERLEAHIEAVLPDWSLAAVVRALQAMRGMALVVAATLVAELGDMMRFANPRQLGVRDRERANIILLRMSSCTAIESQV